MQLLSSAVRLYIGVEAETDRLHATSGLPCQTADQPLSSIVIATHRLMQSTPQPSLQPFEPPQPSKSGGSNMVNLLRIVILVVLVGGSAYLLLTHLNWFEDPRLVKREVLDCGVWGPIVYILLFAIGPSFLVPGAVMTIAGRSRLRCVMGRAVVDDWRVSRRPGRIRRRTVSRPLVRRADYRRAVACAG